MTTFIWGENEQGKKTWVEKPRKTAARFHSVHGDIDTFVSPVDSSVVNGRADLREHNKRHNVINDLDSIKEQSQRELSRAAKHPTAGTRRERIALIRDEFERHQSTGNNRDLNR
jgi:MFS superfamily sulfate permease-like transporter